MQGISAKLDWTRMLGFEQIAADRSALAKSEKLDAKVGAKVGAKLGAKAGIKV